MLIELPDAQVAALLRECKTIAVVGLSDNWLRPSYTTSRYMQARGYRIVPVNPKGGEILGEVCYKSLSDIPFLVDMVNVFRRPEDVLAVAQELLRIPGHLGAKCFWQQLGIDNTQAGELVAQAGLQSVMDRCVKIEHARLLR
jgi:predicted CoA-binding protein